MIVVTKSPELLDFLEANLQAAKTLSWASVFTVHREIDPQLTTVFLKEIMDEHTTVYANLQVSFLAAIFIFSNTCIPFYAYKHVELSGEC